MKAPVVVTKIIKVNALQRVEADDLLAAEEPLEIRLGFGPANNRQQQNVSITMRTPGNDFELATGFLFTEGIIHAQQDVMLVRYCTEANTLENQENIVRVELHEHVEADLNRLQRNFYTTSSCGVCGKASIEAVEAVCPFPAAEDQLRFSADLLCTLPGLLQQKQNVFAHTGGLHACALFDTNGNLLLSREDVGRHNALDKLIGAMLAQSSMPLQNHLLLLSGRASFELIQKAAMAGILVVAAVGAPSSLAVETAKAFGITLVGFLRDNRFNIYTHPERIG